MPSPTTAASAKSKPSSQSKQSSKPSSASNVRVVARIRPLSAREKNDQAILNALESKLVHVKGPHQRWFELDAVLDGDSTQSELYEASGASTAVRTDLFSGFHCTILAYGQTGAGKTFSMGTAAATAVDESSGIIPRACADVFEEIQKQCDGNAQVELSCLELYNEQMRDLLCTAKDGAALTKANKALKIRQTLTGEIYVAGLTAVPVESPAAIGKLMEAASDRRVTAATQMNAVSSRSHAICTLRIKGVLEDGQQFQSKLTLVDLAGSERIKKTGAVGARQAEGININKSLLVLGQVVSALSSRGNRKPPYRDSQLTRLLQDSLGGNSRTLMIACVSPAEQNLDESVNTLRYATAARNITNTATKNMVETVTPEQAAALKRENELLKSQVAELTGMLEKMSSQQQVVTEEVAASEHSESTGRTTATTSIDDLQQQLQQANALAITVPRLKLEITQLEEKVASVDETVTENQSLRQQLDEAQQDAESARMAASYLSDICERLKDIQRDELRSKQQHLQQIEKEQHWIAFVHMMLENYRMQVRDLCNEFDKKVVRAVEQMEKAAAAEDPQQQNKGPIKSALSWISKQPVWPWREATRFFKGRLQELEDSIQWEAESLQRIQGSLETDYSAVRKEVGAEETRCASLETDTTLVDQLTTLLLGEKRGGRKNGEESAEGQPADAAAAPMETDAENQHPTSNGGMDRIQEGKEDGALEVEPSVETEL